MVSPEDTATPTTTPTSASTTSANGSSITKLTAMADLHLLQDMLTKAMNILNTQLLHSQK